MSPFGGKHQSYLKEKFRSRASFDKTERKLYGHDIAALPSLIKPLLGNTTPDAVVQPETEKELVELVRWARENHISLTPRGKASSGYGGVLPVRQGVVVDFYRMNKIIRIDPEALTASVESGVVWEKLDQELERYGLTLRLYPSSYPSSTVGGWLAQGGAGIGSYEAGWFRDNVVSARVVLPDGEVMDLKGADLDFVSEVEGITGLISEVTIRVQPLEEIDIVSISSPRAHDFQQLAQSLIDRKVPIWSLIFINPRMADLKNKAPLMEHDGHPVEERIALPLSYITTLAFRRKDREVVTAQLPELLRSCKAELLPNEIAQHEWKNRFKLMLVKRLGPSLVPSEIVVPLSALGDVMEEIEDKVKQPLVKEGVVIRQGANGRPEVVILGFIPSDERKFMYNLVFGLILTVTKIAEKHGGRAFATGIYLGKKAPLILGERRVKRLKALKAQIDPKSIMNPGKVIASGLLGRAISLAEFFEPLLGLVGNSVVTQIGERPTKPIRGIPADVAWYAYGCSQCGYCVDECDQFYGRGWESQSPRGKWYWLREYMEGREEWDQRMVDTILVCTTCELCNLRCSASLPIEPSWMKLRGLLINEKKEMTFPTFEMMGASLQKEGNIWAAYRRNRAAWFPKDLEEKHGPSHHAKAAYFAGCTASYVENDIALATVRLLDAAGVDFTYTGQKENCCGIPMLAAGKWDVFEETFRKNLQVMKEAGVDTVVASCPACNMMWRQVYPAWAKKLGIEYSITARHYSEVLAEKIKEGKLSFPSKREQKTVLVTWHDSCHIGRASGVYEPPREVIRAIPGFNLVEMQHNREAGHCCGSVLTLIKDPPVAAEIGKTRLDEALETGAEKVIALCPCCEFQFRVTADKKKIPIEVVDLAHFAASALGYNFPDPHPEVRRQWAVFEAMIALMTPQGFAHLMSTMWPELVDAMPFGMGLMMRFMGKIPGALDLMKPMFSILFPRLLSLMMPKVMPVMLERVAEQIPMPDYMQGQMGEIMPKVMDQLMPHMIGDVVPLVTQPMIDYLRKTH
ncbi:MAG: FAD-binding and (Fe-S)-binding domain-containing protein [bacterium]